MRVESYGRILFVQGVGMNSNSVVVDDEKKAVIDPGLPDNYYLLGVMKKRGIAPDAVEVVVDTEPHADHCGGNVLFPSARVYAGREAADYISAADPKYTVSGLFGVTLKKRRVLPLKEGDVLDFGETSFRVIETPGHAPGGISLYEPDLKILVCGDVAFKEGIGRTDLPGGDIRALRKSIERLCGLDVDVFLPGHGPPGFKEHLVQALHLANVLAPGVGGK